MEYWATVHKRALKETRELARMDSPGRVLVTSFGILVPPAIGWELAHGVDNIARMLSAIGALATAFLMIYSWKMFSIPPQIDSCRDMIIRDLEIDVARLNEQLESDLVMYLDPNPWGVSHPDFPPLDRYNVVVENLGPAEITNCQLKRYAINRLNHDLLDRTSLSPASEIFSLRPNDPRILPIIYFDRDDREAVAMLETTSDGGGILSGAGGYPIFTPDGGVNYVFVELLTAEKNNQARLTLRIRYDEAAGWQIAALQPGEAIEF